MRGFTLIEVAVVLLILVVISSIVFSFNAFNRDFFYLRDVAKQLSFALNTVSDLSQTIIERNNRYYCGYGIYFPDATSFEVLAFATSTKICAETMATSSAIRNFITHNLNPGNKTFVLQNQDLVTTIIPALSLNINLKEGYQIVFSTSSANTCENSISPPLIFLYVYSFYDIFFLNQYPPNTGNWDKISTNEIYICLRRPPTEFYIIRINKLGQISIIR
jgi:prepilin-type N-terminal cleavage/methylation domain-containing protein